MPKRTDLASGAIHGNSQLRVELIEPNRGKPPVIAIAAAMRILANSVVTLASIRVQRKL